MAARVVVVTQYSVYDADGRLHGTSYTCLTANCPIWPGDLSSDPNKGHVPGTRTSKLTSSGHSKYHIFSELEAPGMLIFVDDLAIAMLARNFFARKENSCLSHVFTGRWNGGSDMEFHWPSSICCISSIEFTIIVSWHEIVFSSGNAYAFNLTNCLQ